MRPEFSGFHLSMLWIMEQENQKWFHSSWPVSNAQLLKLLQRPQSSRIKSLLGHSQFSLGPAHSLRYAVGHRDPLTRWANVSKCEQTQIMTRLTKNNTIFDIESYILLHRISFHKCQAKNVPLTPLQLTTANYHRTISQTLYGLLLLAIIMLTEEECVIISRSAFLGACARGKW